MSEHVHDFFIHSFPKLMLNEGSHLSNGGLDLPVCLIHRIFVEIFQFVDSFSNYTLAKNHA
jgi:hypothetical protein